MRLTTRTLGQKETFVGALSSESEAALGAFLEAHPRYRELDRSVHLALYTAHQARDQAAWSELTGLGVVVGSSRGATGLWEGYYAAFLAGDGRTPPLTSPTTTLGNLSSWVAQHMEASGPVAELSATCSSSLSAVAIAMAWLRAGMAERFLAGGTEAPLTDFTLAQMRALRIYTNDPLPYPCRPCATDRGRVNSMVLGEGACLLALEPWTERASSRCRALLRGVGMAVEPIRTNTALSAEGQAVRLAMERALLDAGLGRVDAVVTHTPGTALGDRGELYALGEVFGGDLPILTSNKWMLGHTLGASGALGIEYALYLLEEQTWVEYPYPVPFENRKRPIETVMINSVGFGGNAASVILSRPLG
jgi:3-oxoacyl-(acyl-carrier-protein) synthase